MLNPTLALDSRLFVDPLLLGQSKHPEIAEAAHTFKAHFALVIKLLSKSEAEGDVAWRNADRLFRFPEFPGTCLGYGMNSVRGSAIGPGLRYRLMVTARQVIALGIRDTDLFLSLALFEEKYGPDRISDLTCNVVAKDLLAFNSRILAGLKIPLAPFTVNGHNTELPVNPFPTQRTPIILVPNDVLRPLPVVTDWSGVSSAAAENDLLRSRVNTHVGAIWEAKSTEAKRELKSQALTSKEAYQALLDAIHHVPTNAYDVEGDPRGLLGWADAAFAFAESHPLRLRKTAKPDLDSVHALVLQIIRQFRQLVEENGLNDYLWHQNKALPEKFAQRLFFAVAYSYCKANDLDISPEVDSGNGQIDFKVSVGFHQRVLVELKLSNHNKVVPGFTSQLEAYKASEETMRAVYLVLDVGKMGNKRKALLAVRNDAAKEGAPVSDLEFVDARRKPSASKRR